ncbi:MAG TPA: VWA domain-containing protein, partial [Phycisphaerae bacterium]|nr:VWA domain-containing protein [Phycisphaerae bacterium]
MDKLKGELKAQGIAGAESDLAQAASLARTDAGFIRRSQTLRAAKGELHSTQLGSALRSAQEAAATKATDADRLYLRDKKGSGELTNAESRVEAANRAAIAYGVLGGTDAEGARLLNGLNKQYHIRIANFSDKTETAALVDQGSLDDALKASLVPAGQSTNMASALQFVAEQVQAGEAASVIVVSDGQHNTGPDPRGVARNLAARGVRVFGLMVGSREMSPDAAVEPVDFPDWIYSGDTIKPRALIRLDGLAGKNAEVELRRDGQVLERQPMRSSTGHELIPFDFTDKPPESDKVLEYEIRVSQMPGEVNTQNNVATFRVAVKKNKLAALIVEDRPRWEFRYLAGYLSQRPGFKLQTVLLQPANIVGIAQPAGIVASPENPRTEAQRLPDTLEGWQKFDLIVLGDVGPEVITPPMQQFIASAVRDKGSTVIAIAGQRSMPSKYTQGPLAEVLPITMNPQWRPDQVSQHMRTGFKPETAPTAGMAVLASLGADASTNSRAWQAMPEWYWH